MSHNMDPNPMQLVTCPYNPAHQIRVTRMPYHLAKCKKNHPGENHETCPFNARHVILKSDYRYHVETCPDKAIIERNMTYGNEIILNEPSYLDNENATIQDDFMENWDLSPPVLPPVPHVHPAIESNPELKAKYELVKKQQNGLQFNRTIGMKPSEKRLHRERVRLEAEEIQNGLSPGTSDSPSIIQNGMQESLAQLANVVDTKMMSFSAAVQQMREPKTAPTKKKPNGEKVARFPASNRIAANIFGHNPLVVQKSSTAVPPVRDDSAATLAALSRGRGVPTSSYTNGFPPLGRGAGFPTYPPTTGISPLGRGAGCYISANGAVGPLNTRPPPGISGVYGAIPPMVQIPAATKNNCRNNGDRND